MARLYQQSVVYPLRIGAAFVIPFIVFFILATVQNGWMGLLGQGAILCGFCAISLPIVALCCHGSLPVHARSEYLKYYKQTSPASHQVVSVNEEHSFRIID